MTKIIISNNNSISVELKGEWLYLSLTDNLYKSYLTTLSNLYQRKYKLDSLLIPNFEMVLELIHSQDFLRGYRFSARKEKLFYTIFNFNLNTRKRIGEKFIKNFLEGGYKSVYRFNGFRTESEIRKCKYNEIQGVYELDVDSISFPNFVENMLLYQTKDDLINHFGMSYIINYMLNTQPRKLDFLINEVK